jgi:hypothetical protein
VTAPTPNAALARRFHIGDILSVTTGCLVSPEHMGGVYNILNWMTGDDLFTHQLPRANDECEPHLRIQHPDLAEVTAPDFSTIPRAEVEQAVAEWLAKQVERFGEYRHVVPLAAGDHTRIDPIAELTMMRPDMPIIVVRPDGGEGGSADGDPA